MPLARLRQSCAPHQYDAVVSGVRLTEAQGPQTVAALRQAAPEIALLMMSSAEDRDLMSETIAAGADNYLIKDVADGNRIALGILYARQKRSGKGFAQCGIREIFK